MNAQPTALGTYLARAAAIHAKLERLQQLADDHFGHDPDAIHGGHVGDLGRVDQALGDLLAIFDGQPEWRRSRWKPCPRSPQRMGSEIAQREGLHHSTVNELLRLTLLESAIIQRIVAGQQPRCMSLLWLQRNPLPTDWMAQREMVAGFDA